MVVFLSSDKTFSQEIKSLPRDKSLCRESVSRGNIVSRDVNVSRGINVSIEIKNLRRDYTKIPGLAVKLEIQRTNLKIENVIVVLEK